MPHAVAIDQFEGPLGLLLELVERNKMPVTNIAVATITAQYLEHLATFNDLSAEELGEFLQLGSRLVYIKSLALLPSAEPDEQADELRQLSRELAEYQKFQAAAKVLAGRPSSHPRGAITRLDPNELPLPDISLTELTEAFRAALARLEPATPRRVINAELSQQEVLTRLHKRLSQGSFELSELLGSLTDRLEVIVTFSALLELIRAGEGRVTQATQFAPILVEPV